MSHQQPLGGPGQPPPTSYPSQQPYPPPPPQHQQPMAPSAYGYVPPPPPAQAQAAEYHGHELDALPSIRSLYAPPIQRPQAGGGAGVELGMGIGQSFYGGVVPMGPQYLQSEGLMRYPMLPPDNRFRGPKKVGPCRFV